LRTIPLRIVIFPDLNLQLLAIAAGVIGSLILKLWQFERRSREEAIIAFERLQRAADGAQRGQRLDREYELGVLEFVRASEAIGRKEYEKVVRICDAASEHFHAAREGGDTPLQTPAMTGEEILDTINEIRDKRASFREYLKRARTLAFLLITLLTLVLIIQTWTQFITQINSLSFNYLWLFNAFLLGFGSQSIVGELFELLGRRLR
jgi:hypothetical protein